MAPAQGRPFCGIAGGCKGENRTGRISCTAHHEDQTGHEAGVWGAEFREIEIEVEIGIEGFSASRAESAERLPSPCRSCLGHEGTREGRQGPEGHASIRWPGRSPHGMEFQHGPCEAVRAGAASVKAEAPSPPWSKWHPGGAGLHLEEVVAAALCRRVESTVCTSTERGDRFGNGRISADASCAPHSGGQESTGRVQPGRCSSGRVPRTSATPS